MSKQVEWDALVNARIGQIQDAIDRMTLEKTTIDARIVIMSGGENADVASVLSGLEAQSGRIASRIANQELAKSAVTTRLYASLSAPIQAIVDNVCSTSSLHVQTMLAQNNVDIAVAHQRCEDGCASVANPECIDQDTCDSMLISIIQRMQQGQ